MKKKPGLLHLWYRMRSEADQYPYLESLGVRTRGDHAEARGLSDLMAWYDWSLDIPWPCAQL